MITSTMTRQMAESIMSMGDTNAEREQAVRFIYAHYSDALANELASLAVFIANEITKERR